MALRFRKSVKICKGLKVNFSKSGPSLSIGGKGHSVNFGKRGTTVTHSIPGTGISWKTSLGGSSNKPSRSTSSKSISNSSNRISLPSTVTLSIEADGKFIFKDPSGFVITDSSTIRKLKALPNVKEQMLRLDRERVQKNARIVENQYESMQQFLNLHRLSPKVMTKGEWASEYANMQQQQYEVQQYSEPKPDPVEIERILRNEAESNVTTHAFWRAKKLREDYVADFLPKRIKEMEDVWQSAKDEFDAKEKATAERMNADYAKQFEEDREALAKCIRGDASYVENAIDNWFEDCTLPVEIDISYLFKPEKGSVSIDMDLPEIEDIPECEFTQLANGSLKEKRKTQTVLKQEYAVLVFGLAVFVCANVFNVSPAIKTILLSGYTQRRDKDGNINDDYIYSIKFPRKAFEGIDIRSISPMEFCLQFENRCKMTSTQLFKTIIPFDPEEEGL